MPPFSNLHWNGLTLSAGLLFTLAFAPFDYPYLAPIALSLLFAAWQNTSAKQAALRGYCFGLGCFGLGISWVYISIHDFGGANSLAASLMTLLCAGFWGSFSAIAGYLCVKLQSPKAVNSSYLVMPVIWVGVEYLRGELVLNGFPWFQAAYSQLNTPLAGYIPILGAHGTSLIVALTASGCLALLSKLQYKAIIAGLLISVWALGGYLTTIEWTHENGAPIQVSLLQGNITQDQKWRPENKLKTLQWYQAMTEAHWDSALIVWPETAVPAYLADVQDNFIKPLNQAAIQHHSTVVVSLPIKNADTKERFNAVMTLGDTTGIYKKRHLLPFGEYLPLQPLSGFILDSLDIMLGQFTAGAKDQALLIGAGYPFSTSICYEDAFGALGLVNIEAAAFLINVTNDGWFGDSIEPAQHLQMARMRALETGRYLLRATNTGITAIINPKGLLLSQLPQFEATVLTGTIRPMTGLTPYARLAK